MTPIHDRLTLEMTEPQIRLGHLLWHASRDWWLRASEARRKEFVTRLHWSPPRPALDERGMPRIGIGAGIDFLGVHRAMLEHAEHILSHSGQPPVIQWPSLPAADDRSYPVPGGVNFPSLSYPSKDDTTWRAFLEQAECLIAHENLRHISLDELGTRLEYGIHNALHERFGGLSSAGTLRLTNRLMLGSIQDQFNDPCYDSLLDPYAAHVHPWFWRIHRWVDNCITLWEKARGEQADLSKAWHGPMKHHHVGPADAGLLKAQFSALATFAGGMPVIFFTPRLLPEV